MDKDSEVTGDIITKEDREFIKYYKKEVLPNDPNYKIVRRIMSTGYNMMPGIGQTKLILEILVGKDLITGDKYELIDTASTSFMIQKNIAEQKLIQIKNLSGLGRTASPIENQKSIGSFTKSQGKVFINDGTPGGTTVANQIRFTDSSGNMIILENNLTTGGTSLQLINSLGQRIYENSLVPLLTINKTPSTVPLLIGDGANKVSQVPSITYNPVLKLPVKYQNLTDSENKFLNDYMNKEIPGEIVSKYNDVNKYEYNATTNPGPLANSRNQPIKNFYGGMYNKRILTESEIYFRAGDTGVKKEYGSYYTKNFPKSSIQVRTDSAVKLYWLKLDGTLDSMSPLNRVYMIEFPAGTEVYEGPIGYQEGGHLGGLKNEQIFIEDAWKKGTVKSSFPLERKKELVIPSEIKKEKGE